jgi:hypothetical protein
MVSFFSPDIPNNPNHGLSGLLPNRFCVLSRGAAKDLSPLPRLTGCLLIESTPCRPWVGSSAAPRLSSVEDSRYRFFPYNSNMQEAAIALIVLIVGIIVGALLKPTEAQLAPLSPDDIRGHAAPEPDSHHH